MAKNLQLDTTLSLAQTARLIGLNGHKKTYLVRGEPGIGKSAMLKTLAQKYPDHTPVYVDMTQMDIGDIQIPYINQNTQTVDYFPNAMFQTNLSGNKPVIVMLDEFGKANRAVQNVCLPIMLERRVGKFHLHPESIVFATSNLTTDNVGDNIQSHANNRLGHLVVRKPNADEWVHWGIENGVHETILVAVRENPHWMLSYTDNGQKDNEYIYQPKRPVNAFITPRSLEAASHSMHNRDKLGDEQALFADLAGTIGPRAAADMRAQVDLLDQLPPLASIIADPKGALLPRNMPAMTLLTFSLLARTQKDNFTPILTYVDRMPTELQCLFVVQLIKVASKVQYCATNQKFTEWVGKYGNIAM